MKENTDNSNDHQGPKADTNHNYYEPFVAYKGKPLRTERNLPDENAQIRFGDHDEGAEQKEEKNHLRKDYKIALRKYEEKSPKKVIEYLRSKGYRYNEIMAIMREENDHEMD